MLSRVIYCCLLIVWNAPLTHAATIVQRDSIGRNENGDFTSTLIDGMPGASTSLSSDFGNVIAASPGSQFTPTQADLVDFMDLLN